MDVPDVVVECQSCAKFPFRQWACTFDVLGCRVLQGRGRPRVQPRPWPAQQVDLTVNNERMPAISEGGIVSGTNHVVVDLNFDFSRNVVVDKTSVSRTCSIALHERPASEHRGKHSLSTNLESKFVRKCAVLFGPPRPVNPVASTSALVTLFPSTWFAKTTPRAVGQHTLCKPGAPRCSDMMLTRLASYLLASAAC